MCITYINHAHRLTCIKHAVKPVSEVGRVQSLGHVRLWVLILPDNRNCGIERQMPGPALQVAVIVGLSSKEKIHPLKMFELS